MITRVPRRVWIGILAAAVAAAAIAVPLSLTAGRAVGHDAELSTARDSSWRQDIAYLASELPRLRVDGTGQISSAAWEAAARKLEAQVPTLTQGQVIVGMARMVAMLHDDETDLGFPSGPTYRLYAQWFGSDLYVLGASPSDRDLIGSQLLAIDGMPIAQVTARLAAVIDYQDTGVLRAEQAGFLDDGDLLNWLGITSSATSAEFTVRTTSGAARTARLTASGSGFVFMATPEVIPLFHLASVPLPLYEQDMTAPYWMRVLPVQHAVYLKYNQCLDDAGFQQLAAKAIAILKQQPGYRLIIDLRGNLGGDSDPFQPLVTAIRDDPAIDSPQRVVALVDQFTDSAATVDLGNLASATKARLMGTPPMDPLDEFGDEATFTLPESGITVQYTTQFVNQGGPMGEPAVSIAPTLSQVLAGKDPVLTAALS